MNTRFCIGILFLEKCRVFQGFLFDGKQHMCLSAVLKLKFHVTDFLQKPVFQNKAQNAN